MIIYITNIYNMETWKQQQNTADFGHLASIQIFLQMHVRPDTIDGSRIS